MSEGGLSHSVAKFNTLVVHTEGFVLMLFCLLSMSAINQYTKAREKKILQSDKVFDQWENAERGIYKRIPRGAMKITNYEFK